MPDFEGSLREQIEESPGAKYFNRAQSRTFSLNIFQMNALELMEATYRIRDPHEGLSLMSEDNKEAGTQAHRELSRHIHNFVASSKTLVDHTRVFMNQYYADTDVIKLYREEVLRAFATDPVSKFVHDLRNYMLHKGLPNSQMFISFKRDISNPDSTDELRTGIRIDTASLLGWESWTAPARQYLKVVGEHLDIHRFVEDYLVRVNRFHEWLEGVLEVHHRDDVRRLEDLQRQYDASTSTQSADKAAADENVSGDDVEQFEFSPSATIEINDEAIALLNKIREVTLQKASGEMFPTRRQISLTLTDEDIVETPLFWCKDIDGEWVFTFIELDQKILGLSDRDYKNLDDITNKVFSVTWTRGHLSRKFIENVFISWARSVFSKDRNSFADFLQARAIETVRSVEVWAPVAHLEIEDTVDFGPVRLAPITADKMDALERLCREVPPAESEGVAKLFKKLRAELQGLAAVVVPMVAEPILAEERGRLIAQDVVSLLRFFSPAASVSRQLCPTALLGGEFIPRSKLLIESEGTLSITEKSLTEGATFWRLSRAETNHLIEQGLREAVDLVLPSKLNQFETAIRSGLILFSKSTTSADPVDRLTGVLSALEGVFLRHELEPVQASVARRVSYMLTKSRVEREEVQQVVRQAYRLRERTRLNALDLREEEILSTIVAYAHLALRTALRNAKSFKSKGGFADAVDSLGMTST